MAKNCSLLLGMTLGWLAGVPYFSFVCVILRCWWYLCVKDAEPGQRCPLITDAIHVRIVKTNSFWSFTSEMWSFSFWWRVSLGLRRARIVLKHSMLCVSRCDISLSRVLFYWCGGGLCLQGMQPVLQTKHPTQQQTLWTVPCFTAAFHHHVPSENGP